MGVDIWAAEVILELKQEPRFADICLCVALPFPEYKQRFDPKQQTRLRDILRACDEQVTTSPEDSTQAYYARDQYMIDRSDCVLAVYDNDSSIRSGTGQTVNYARKKKGLPVTLIHPDTAQISQVPSE